MNDARFLNPVLPASDWRRSNRLFLATFAGILAVVYVFILPVDPCRVVPFSLPFERPIMTSSVDDATSRSPTERLREAAIHSANGGTDAPGH